MTVHVLARFHCVTETIEAVHYGVHKGGTYDYGLRFFGGKHDNSVTMCRTEQSVIGLFDLAVAARKADASLWWLDVA